MSDNQDAAFEEFLSRKLHLSNSDGQPVKILIAKPMAQGDENWSCSYRVTGLSEVKSDTYSVIGDDSVQALRNAMTVIEGLLAGTDAAQQGRLRWLDRSCDFLK